MTLDQVAAHVAVRPQRTFESFVDDVVTHFGRWQQYGLCTHPGRASNYSVGALRGRNAAERAEHAEKLCAGCPVFYECGIYALATAPPDCVVAGVPFTGHPTQRRRLVEVLRLTSWQLDHLRKLPRSRIS